MEKQLEEILLKQKNEDEEMFEFSKHRSNTMGTKMGKQFSGYSHVELQRQ